MLEEVKFFERILCKNVNELTDAERKELHERFLKVDLSKLSPDEIKERNKKLEEIIRRWAI